MYKTMKVFDCQNGMPKAVIEVFFEENSELNNNCYVLREVCSLTLAEDYSIVDAWLLENGAQAGEYVLIAHSW